ncbi:MAG TPA: ABC transporter permease [Actinomycetota bacterium]|nr:ABC transporter permease [Actinomycetota bacterium]
MSTAALTLRQLRYENKSFWRNPASAFFTFAFPLMFLVIFNLLFGSSDFGPPGSEISGSTFYVPAIAAFSVITACYTNIAISTTFLRDEGVLKRVRGTPLPPLSYLLARMFHATIMAVVLVAIVVVFGALLYDVEVPTSNLVELTGIVALGAFTFSALGLAATAMIPNADAAPPVVNATILPLLFISDVFIPLASAPDWLESVAKVFPIWHYSHAMLTVFEPSGAFEGGNLWIVGAWGLAGVALATRFFTWEPRK